MADDVSVKFGGQTADLNAAIDAVKSKIASMGDGTAGLVSNFMSIGATIASALAIDKVVSFAEKIGDVAEQLERTSEIAGIAADEILGLQSAAKMTGGSAESATAALMFLEKNISKAASGSKEARQALLDAGISLQTIKTGDASKALSEMADKFAASANGAGKIEVAMNAAGRGGKELIPILNKGSEGLDAFRKAAMESNSVLLKNGETFAEIEDNIQRMHAASTNLWNSFYAELAPAVNAAIIAFTDWTKELTKSNEKGNLLIDIIHGIGTAFTGIVLSINAVKTAVEIIFDVMVGGFEWLITKAIDIGEGIVDFYSGAGRAIRLALSGEFKAAGSEIEKAQALAMEHVREKHQYVTDDIKRRWDEALQHATNFWTSSAKIVAAAEAPAVGMKKETGEKLKPAMKSTRVVDTEKDQASLLEKERQGLMDTYELRRQYDEFNVQSGRMSYDEMFADLNDALDRQHDLLIESYNKQAELYKDDAAKYKLVIADKEKEDTRYISQKMKLESESLKQTQKTWDSAFKVIENSFDGMVEGILRGTLTIQGAFKNMAANLIISMLNACAKMALEWIKKEALQTAATISGNSARSSADMAASATSKLAGKAAASSQIMMDAKESAANVYADVSAIPYVGWILAPPAAATAFAAVAAYNSFDQGTNLVPTNMTANIHKGERIVPKADNERLMQALEGGGGGAQVHFHIRAMDSRDVKRFLNKHGKSIGRQMQSYIRDGGRIAFANS